MTRIAKSQMPIQCECGTVHIVDLYDSINAEMDEELNKKLKNREINVVPCKSHGTGDIAYPLLYTDNNHGMWVYIYPKQMESMRKKIEKGNIKEMKKTMKRMFGKSGSNIQLVFGYDEFFSLIKEK